MPNPIPSDHLGLTGVGLVWEKRHQFVQKNCFWQETKGYCSAVLKKNLDFWPSVRLVPWKTNQKEALKIWSNIYMRVWYIYIFWYIYFWYIFDIYLPFILVSSSQLLKPVEFPKWSKWQRHFLLWGEFWTPSEEGWWLLGEPIMWSEGWDFQSHPFLTPLTSREGRTTDWVHQWSMI